MHYTFCIINYSFFRFSWFKYFSSIDVRVIFWSNFVVSNLSDNVAFACDAVINDSSLPNIIEKNSGTLSETGNDVSYFDKCCDDVCSENNCEDLPFASKSNLQQSLNVDEIKCEKLTVQDSLSGYVIFCVV